MTSRLPDSNASPFGDGHAAEKIVAAVKSALNLQQRRQAADSVAATLSFAQ